MSYLVLARKWRPRNFSETVGQEHVLKALTNALESERLHHAYLFTGTRGVGKTTIARILAKALNCETGITAEPCGECSACREIDEGRFVDLIEVDAASNTKVDDTRELLDNVQYTPARGRYKVYLIDEVHMLSKHSFNALLKTLEEPPPHVKFLLATTDPQRLPVTVLSRCLQFNLKRLTPTLIRDQLQRICAAEAVEAEEAALTLIARAADGSMRDALSLLDQAIAFCAGNVAATPVGEMLGTIDRQYVGQILQNLCADDAPGLMQTVTDIDEHFPDYARLLDDLARCLQQIAVYQATGVAGDDEALDSESLIDMASRLSAEDTQLFYQTAITGRRDIELAPDPRSGAEMTLLRMLAFRPVTDKALPTNPQRAAASVAVASVERTTSTKSGTWRDPDWGQLIEALSLRGANKLFASNCAYLRRQGGSLVLGLDARSESLHTPARQQALAEALSEHYGEALRVEIETQTRESAVDTPSPLQEQERQQDAQLVAARESLQADPNVRTLKDMFGAEMQPDSVEFIGNDGKVQGSSE